MSESAIATVPARPDVHQLLARVGDRSLSFDARLTSVGEVMKATAGRMMAALPKHVTPDRMMRVALNAIRKNPKLLDCSAASLFGAITEAATYGWEIGGILGHAYLVPFGDECVLVPGYKGLIDLCRRSGQISTISMEVVHQGDDFRYAMGDDPHVHHRPNDTDKQRDSKPITYVYAVVRLRDGGVQRSVWSTEKIDAHKEKYSQSWKRAETSQYGKPPKKDSFWHTAWPAAAKKTVILDMIHRGLLPVSAEYREVVDRGTKAGDDPMDFGTFDMLPPSAAEPPIGIEDGTVDAGERPQTGDAVDQDILELARMDIAAAADGEAADFAAHEIIQAKQPNDATVAAIQALVKDRKAALVKPKGKKQGELVN